MSRWISFFVQRSFVVNLISLAICGIGLFLAFQLKRDLIPQIEISTINIEAYLPGASPASIEREIVFPIQESLIGMPAIRRMHASASSDRANISLNLKPSVRDIDQVVEDVRARLQSLRGSTLPDSLERLEAHPIRQQSVEFQAYAVTGLDPLNPRDRLWIKALQENIRRLSGVVQVDISLPEQHLFLEFDQKKLSHYGVSLSQARARALEYFRLTTMGYFEQSGEQIIIDVRKPVDELAQIAKLPIKSSLSGESIRLSQLAEIAVRSHRQTVQELWDGKPYVFLQIRKDLDTDAIHLTKIIKDEVERFQTVQPHPSAHLEMVYDTSDLIQQQLDVLKDNGFYGFVLVMVFLTAFVGFRAAVMTSLSLPIAYLGTIIVLYLLGISIDLISVIGMIIVIGLLVDDAIIVSEKYSQNLEAGMKPEEAANSAAKSLIIPVSGTILTTIVAFLPILLIPSDVGQVFKSIPIVIISALALSWIECFFVLPNHLQHFVKKPAAHGLQIFRPLEKLYRLFIAQFIRFRYAVLLGVIGLIAASGYLMSEKVKTNFNLRLGPKALYVVAILEDHQLGSLAHTEALLQPVQDAVLELQEQYPIKVRSMVGRAFFDGKHRNGERYAQLIIYDNRNQIEQAADEGRLEDEIRKRINQLNQSPFESLTFMVSRAGDNEAKEHTATIYVAGDDRLGFDELGHRVQAAVSGVEGFDAAFIDSDDLVQNWQFEVNPLALSRYGISAAELSSQISSLFSPVRVGQTRLSGEAVNIYTELKRGDTLHFPDLGSLVVLNAQGIEIPLHYLGKWQQSQALRVIRHRDGQRIFEIDLKYDPNLTDLRQFQSAVDLAIAPLRSEFPNFSLSVEAGDQAQDDARQWMINSMVLSVSLIILVLALTLGSVFQPLLVGLVIPFGMITVIWALYFHGMELGLMSMIGLLGVAGVAVNDSLIMVHAINATDGARSFGSRRRQAVVSGASSRLRAILLTTITTLGGVLPMAYGWGGDSGFTASLAFSIGWGILGATLATLLFVPVMLELIYDWRRIGVWIYKRFKVYRLRKVLRAEANQSSSKERTDPKKVSPAIR